MRIPLRPTQLSALLVAALAPALMSPSAFALPQSKVAAELAQDWAIQDWQSQHGEAWQVHRNARTGSVELLFGGRAAPAFQPSTNRPEDWFSLTRSWVGQTQAMHGVRVKDLAKPRFRYLPLGQVGTTDKISVRFEQVVDGIPVENGAVNALFDTKGQLLSLHSTAAPVLPSPVAGPKVSGDSARQATVADFEERLSTRPQTTWQRLAYAPFDVDGQVTWRLVWQVDAQGEDAAGSPLGRQYSIDAATGDVLKSEDTVHHFDVFGRVSAYATPGLEPDGPNNPAMPEAMPRVTVTSSAGNTETDRFGNFTIVGVNSPIDITVSMQGSLTDVYDQASTNQFSRTFLAVQPNQFQDLLMNTGTGSEFHVAQANAQVQINKVRDYIRDRFPTDDTADFQAIAEMNSLGAICNGAFNGDRIVLGRAGTNGPNTCGNTGFSTLIAHEMGHWLNVRYGTTNVGGGMGEGNADVFAMYIHDTPLVSSGIFGPGTFYRTGNNLKPYCGDLNVNCYGGPHADGEVWMGAAWKVRRFLGTSLGDTLGDLTADLLFLGWMNSFNQTSIHSIIETQWLLLDDDDGDITNGTPNYAAIDQGFRVQGFPGYDLPSVRVAVSSPVPNSLTSTSASTVSATITPLAGALITAAEIRYVVNEGPVMTVPMSPSTSGGSPWTGDIPPVSAPALVRYAVVATDNQGNSGSAPEDGLTTGLEFSVGYLASIHSTDFEQGPAGYALIPNPSVTFGAWLIGDPYGMASEPEDDVTPDGYNCWHTGDSLGGLQTSDVNGGPNFLLGPVMDTSGGSANRVLLLSYWRWYSNSTGANPGADTLVVEAKVDGGAWASVETVGPSGPETIGGWIQKRLNLSALFPGSSTVQLRWNAPDLMGGSVVEAALDEVSLVRFDVLPPPARFCDPAVANSTGLAGTIDSTGSQSIASNSLSLMASNLPSNETGQFVFGSSQANPPIAFGGGFLCVTGQFYRLPLLSTGASGSVTYPVDFTDPATNAANILAGSTWNFQFWFQDSAAGPSNFTDALSIAFGN